MSLYPVGAGGAVCASWINKVLAKVKEAPAFQQQSAKVMPTFCEGSDDMAACKGAIEHGLLCKAFMGKAQEFAQQGMPGAAQFAQKCGPILATSFMDVSGWVEKPGDLFMDLSGKAKKTMAVRTRKQRKTSSTQMRMKRDGGPIFWDGFHLGRRISSRGLRRAAVEVQHSSSI